MRSTKVSKLSGCSSMVFKKIWSFTFGVCSSTARDGSSHGASGLALRPSSRFSKERHDQFSAIAKKKKGGLGEPRGGEEESVKIDRIDSPHHGTGNWCIEFCLCFPLKANMAARGRPHPSCSGGLPQAVLIIEHTFHLQRSMQAYISHTFQFNASILYMECRMDQEGF